MPCGRTSRTRISTTSAGTFFSSVGTPNSGDVSTSTPTTNPPTSAPYAEPRPPSVMPANIRNSSRRPMSNADLLVERRGRCHPRAARAAGDDPDEPDHRWLSMPVAEARSALSLTARVALPSRVVCSAKATATSTTSEISDRDQVAWRDRDRTDVAALLVGVVAQRPCSPAELEQEDVAQHDRQADGDDHLRDQTRCRAGAAGRRCT